MQWVIDRRAPNLQVATSVVVIVAGCIIAGASSSSFGGYECAALHAWLCAQSMSSALTCA